MGMAYKDAASTQVGGLSAGIIGGLLGSVDTQTVYAALPTGFTLNTPLTVATIGGGTEQVADPRYPNKALAFQQAAGAVADGAVVANGYINHTGQALVAGNVVLAVAP